MTGKLQAGRERKQKKQNTSFNCTSSDLRSYCGSPSKQHSRISTGSYGLVSAAQETIRVNVIGTLTLADLCATHGIHMTNFATGAVEALQSMSLGFMIIHRIHSIHMFEVQYVVLACLCHATQYAIGDLA